jgi:hypothetical protein
MFSILDKQPEIGSSRSLNIRRLPSYLLRYKLFASRMKVWRPSVPLSLGRSETSSTIGSCSPRWRGGQWLSQVLDKVGHLCFEFLARKILISLSEYEDKRRKTDPITISEPPDVNNIGVNNVNTVFNGLVSEVVTGPKATPVSYA